MNNIYLIERTDDVSWDEYDSWVVFAPAAPTALGICPTGRKHAISMYRELKCTLLGTSFGETEAKVICASFNAG